MERKYVLDSVTASLGRTLWNNLVIGDKTDTLDQREGFKRKSDKLDIQCSSCCSFDYKGLAMVKVNASGVVSVEADTQEYITETESALKGICEGKGVPLVNLS